ncbi:MAG: PD-(D/E)XK nuclease family protein [Salinibacter sp.]
MTSSLIVEQLSRLRDAHPEAPLVVFVPRTQLGHAVDTALARSRDGWRGVRTLIPRHYAEALAYADIVRSGRREAPVEEGLFRAARILQGLPDDERGGDLPGWHLLASTVAGAVDRLREDAVSVEAVRDRADTPGASETLGVVAACYAHYERGLDEGGFYDDADVYRWATGRVRSGAVPDVPESVYAVADATTLSEHATQFLRALRTQGREFVRLGGPDTTRPPRETVAVRFSDTTRVEARPSGDAPVDGGTETNTPAGPRRFVRAVGAHQEVKAVLRDLLRDDIAFDDATIAYASSTPYASLLADEAERVGIPTTLGPGLPAHQTRTGRALRGWLDWVREDHDPERLIRMLREGLLRTDRWARRRQEAGDAGDGAALRPHRAATLLAERSYEPGRDGLLGGLRAAAAARDDDPPEWETQRRERLDRLADYVEALADLVPRRGDVREVAANACHFLEVFGPDDAPTAPEGTRTLDEAGRALLYDRLQRLSDMSVSLTAGEPRLAALFGRWLDGQRVQAEAPRPGHVHILPLESVGYGDRSHLYVVGLDSTTFDAPLPENGLLQESDHRALVASFDAEDEAEAQPPTPADEALWRADRALRRHRGPTSYYARLFDVEAGEERDPSALFLQREQAAGASGGGRVVGLVPPADAPALSDGDRWLAAYRAARRDADGAGPGDSGSARTRLHDTYPWIADGEAARQARQADRYTAYDGLLPAGTYPDLALFDAEDRPLSASRLETLAEAPYVYFLKYVLGVRPLEEPAVDDEPWLNHRREGTLLHRIYERFMRALGGRPPTPDDADRMRAIVDEILAEEIEQEAPPSAVVEAAARRTLRENATLFLRAEIERGADYRPEHFELGFGVPPRRRQDGDYADGAALSVDGRRLPLRGRIDRVDRNRETGRLVAWDYKTGSTSGYDDSDPVQDGKTLQWALYAYALEALTDETVEESGYFFANVSEVGSRRSADPAPYRAEVEQLLKRLGALAESGTFPVTPNLHRVNDWTWGGYDRLVADLDRRKSALREKAYPEDRPEPPSF